MVNVAGRSKGCTNCRRRKIKCDGNRPTCQRCARIGLDCDGPREIAFVPAIIVQTRGEARTLTQKSSKGRLADVEAWQPTIAAALKDCDIDASICYTRSQMKQGYPIDLALGAIRQGDLSLAATTTDQRMAQYSATAFAFVFYGKLHGIRNLMDQGYIFHGIALKHVNSALAKSDCCLRDEVLLSIATMSLLESLVPSGPKNYINHMMGLQRLLELRGPGKYCSPITKNLYLAVRHMVTFASLRTGTRCIFSTQEWKDTLRSGCAKWQLDEQDLFDFLADICSLQAERNELMERKSRENDDQTSRLLALQSRAVDMLHGLCKWRKIWEAQDRNEYTESSKSNHCLPFGTSETIKGYYFATMTAALNLMLYLTAFIFTLRILNSLQVDRLDLNHGWLQDEGPKIHTKSDLKSAERSAAIEMCRCVPYYLETAFQSNTPMEPIFQWAIGTAWASLEGDTSLEGQWLSDLRRSDGQTLVVRTALVKEG